MAGDAVNGPDARWMPIGRVAGAFGLRGELKVDLLTDFPERFGRLKRVYIGDERREWTVERSRRQGGRVLLKLEGIDSPEAAAKLAGFELAVPRGEAVDLPPGHYYLDDLIGARVVTVDGRDVGPLTEVLRTGSNDVYVVGHGKESILIPAIKDAVEEVDVRAGRVVVQPWVLESAE
jgi:16S rRNA processing protein RimM